jgi:hypothetical protein
MRTVAGEGRGRTWFACIGESTPFPGARGQVSRVWVECSALSICIAREEAHMAEKVPIRAI